LVEKINPKQLLMSVFFAQPDFRLLLNRLIPGLCLLFVHCTNVFGQHPNQSIRSGNEHYKSKEFQKAKQAYQQALKKDAKSEKAMFNAADADYMSGKFEEAAEQFKKIADNTKDRKLKSSSLHNLGNSLLSQKKYPESAKAFADALKLNPADEQSRYNLAYANAMMRKEEQKKQQQKNQDKGKNQNKDKKEQKQKKEGDKEQKQDKKEGAQKKDVNNSKDKKNNKKQEISKEDAARLLNAMNKQEKDLHRKMQKRKTGAKTKAKANIDKDW
jgi:Ca-activated chloride channel family protein